MKKVEEIIMVELTTEENSTVTAALHAAYKEMKYEYEKGGDTEEMLKLYKRMEPVRSLRNDFAALIGSSFMGADA